MSLFKRKPKVDVEALVNAKYRELLMEMRKWISEASTTDERTAAVDAYNAVNKQRLDEIEILTKRSDNRKDRIVQLAVAGLNFTATGVNAGTRLYAFQKGYRLEHEEQGVFTLNTTKEAFKTLAGGK